MNEEEFLQEDFCVDEYLSKILADSSGECSRLKDKHVRILSKHSDALSEEIGDKKEAIRDGLLALSSLIEEAKRISKELPDLFLPLVSSAEQSVNAELHKELEYEIEKMQADLSVAEGRTLKHKENIELRIDRESYTGVILVCEDIVVIGIDTKEGREMYNAFLVKELSCTIEKEHLVLSLPPVRIEITKSDSTLVHLRNKIVGESKASSKRKSPKNSVCIEEIDGIDYSNYLLRIGRIQDIEDPSVSAIVEEIKSVYKISQWKDVSPLLKLLKKKSLLDAAKLYCSIEGSKLEKAIQGIIHQRESPTEVIEKLGVLISHYIKGLEKVFPEPLASGYISLHLEEIHIKASEMFYRSYYIIEALEEQEDKKSEAIREALKKAFTYDGYSYGYTTAAGDEIRKGFLRNRYTFNKQVMQNVFRLLQED